MRFRFVAPLALVTALPLLGGCADSPKQRLEGRWVGESIENFAPEQSSRALGWVRGTSMEFKGSRATVTVPAESPRQGTFKIADTQKDALLVEFHRAQGVTDHAQLELMGEGRLRWRLGDGRSVILRKLDN